MLTKNLKQLRTEHGFTQKRLALIAGIHLRNLQSYEQCKKSAPLEAVLKICLALGCEARDLLDESENEEVLQVLDEYLKMQRRHRKKR